MREPVYLGHGGCGPYISTDVEFVGQCACGLALDYGRAQGNLELRQVLLDAEMLRDCDERAAEEIRGLREELAQARRTVARMGWVERGMENGQQGLGATDDQRPPASNTVRLSKAELQRLYPPRLDGRRRR